MPINGIVESKLRFLEQTLADLEGWSLGDSMEFARNSLLRRAVERALQLAVESMIDVAERILAAQHLVPEDTAAQSLRFRNFIVHRYEQIDPQIVYSLAKGKLSCFRDFVDEVRRACAGETLGRERGDT
jgi:uncharacterized protein YutE (UPF0331/DUF86 family)